jgi:hypothetical protein
MYIYDVEAWPGNSWNISFRYYMYVYLRYNSMRLYLAWKELAYYASCSTAGYYTHNSIKNIYKYKCTTINTIFKYNLHTG